MCSVSSSIFSQQTNFQLLPIVDFVQHCLVCIVWITMDTEQYSRAPDQKNAPDIEAFVFRAFLNWDVNMVDRELENFCDDADPPNTRRALQIKEEMQKASIRRRDALLVRQVSTGAEASPVQYIALYGRNRYKAATDLALKKVPVVVFNLSESGSPIFNQPSQQQRFSAH